MRQVSVVATQIASSADAVRCSGAPCRPSARRALFAGLAVLLLGTTATAGQPPRSILIRDAQVVDGTGAPPRAASVRIVGDRIAAIGQLATLSTDEIVDARGLVLAPGFVDTHSHFVGSFGIGDNYLQKLPDAVAGVSQGITTSIVGMDGRSALPLGLDFAALERAKPAVNVASFIGHGSIRLQVMGDDFRRAARSDEIAAMRKLVRKGMAEGALGLSTGLEYNPGVYSTRQEVLALAAESARRGGRYITHLRSEDRDLWSALDEAIDIGRATKQPVIVSHMKLGMHALWGQASRFIDSLERARADGIDIAGDVYPYDFWQSTLTVLFPERNFSDRAAAAYALNEVVPADGIRFTHYVRDPSLVGRTLAEIAASRGEDPADTLRALIVDDPTPESLELSTMRGMSQADVDRLIQWPYSNICSDGALLDGHPRARGAFTKILRDYVRDRHLLTLEEAVRKMTSLPADRMGLRDRGRIAVGAFADLVLFDAATVADRSTVAQPLALSVGIDKVWVNGGLVYAGGVPTGVRTGRVLRRGATAGPVR
jgi:N-acyl-D-amino-acid deacylase